MNIADYLARIDYSGPTEPNRQVLADLMRHHLEQVPFENLDVDLGIPIELAEDALYDKVVVRGRGGFCYELNGLFAWLLEELGFTVDRLPAAVLREDGSVGPDDGHMTLRVHLDEGFLVDVGFGESHRRPVPWRLGAEHNEPDLTYRIVQDGEVFALEQRTSGAPWQRQFQFTTEPRPLSGYLATCRWTETSPESIFTQNRLASVARPGGRITYTGLTRIETTQEGRTETVYPDDATWRSAMADELGIRLDAP